VTAPEEWGPIADFPDYLVSNRGRVISLKGGKARIRRPAFDPTTGYNKVTLYAGPVVRTRPIHRLVAEAFHQPAPASHEVRHIDGNKLNNRAENLTWGSHSDNMYDHVEHGRHWQARKTHCKWGHPFDEANTYVIPSRPRARYCRACMRARTAASYRRAA